MAAVSDKKFRETLETVGHKVTMCDGPTTCAKAVSTGQFQVVLADRSDAAGLKSGSGTTAVVPVMLKPSKDELDAAKSEFGQAFDASRGSLRLLPVLNTATKGAR